MVWYKKLISSPSDNASKWIIVIVPGLFISVVLVLLKPFGIEYREAKMLFFLILTGYGLCGSFLLYVFEFLIKPRWPYFNAPYLPVVRVIIWYAIILIFATLLNYGYSNSLPFLFQKTGYRFPHISLIHFLFRTVAISIFPFIGLGLYFSQQVKYKKMLFNLKSSRTDTLRIISENEKISINIPVAALFYIEAKSNYIQVVYAENGQIKKELVRTTLKSIEEATLNTAIQRCHHSYIINTAIVKSYRKSSRNAVVYLSGLETPIPVSKKFADSIDKALLNAAI